jgi:hypothetical protein
MSPALKTGCSAPARKPTPPRVPEDGATLDEKGGTSPLTPGGVWVKLAPAGPLSRNEAVGVAVEPGARGVCMSASMLLSAIAAEPGRRRLRRGDQGGELATSGVTIGWPRVNGRPVVTSELQLVTGPP